MEHIVGLTKEDAQEVLHKLAILADNEDIQEDYGLTKNQAMELVRGIPRNGGNWNIPAWGIIAVLEEMKDHIEVLRDIASDAYNEGQKGQALRISKQSKRLEQLFGKSFSVPHESEAI